MVELTPHIDTPGELRAIAQGIGRLASREFIIRHEKITDSDLMFNIDFTRKLLDIITEIEENMYRESTLGKFSYTPLTLQFLEATVRLYDGNRFKCADAVMFLKVLEYFLDRGFNAIVTKNSPEDPIYRMIIQW